jgi:hypothetical protein
MAWSFVCVHNASFHICVLNYIFFNLFEASKAVVSLSSKAVNMYILLKACLDFSKYTRNQVPVKYMNNVFVTHFEL